MATFTFHDQLLVADTSITSSTMLFAAAAIQGSKGHACTTICAQPKVVFYNPQIVFEHSNVYQHCRAYHMSLWRQGLFNWASHMIGAHVLLSCNSEHNKESNDCNSPPSSNDHPDGQCTYQPHQLDMMLAVKQSQSSLT